MCLTCRAGQWKKRGGDHFLLTNCETFIQCMSRSPAYYFFNPSIYHIYYISKLIEKYNVTCIASQCTLILRECCLSYWRYVCLYVCRPVCLYAPLSSLHVCLSVCLIASLLPVCLFVIEGIYCESFSEMLMFFISKYMYKLFIRLASTMLLVLWRYLFKCIFLIYSYLVSY